MVVGILLIIVRSAIAEHATLVRDNVVAPRRSQWSRRSPQQYVQSDQGKNHDDYRFHEVVTYQRILFVHADQTVRARTTRLQVKRRKLIAGRDVNDIPSKTENCGDESRALSRPRPNDFHQCCRQRGISLIRTFRTRQHSSARYTNVRHSANDNCVRGHYDRFTTPSRSCFVWPVRICGPRYLKTYPTRSAVFCNNSIPFRVSYPFYVCCSISVRCRTM